MSISYFIHWAKELYNIHFTRIGKTSKLLSVTELANNGIRILTQMDDLFPEPTFLSIVLLLLINTSMPFVKFSILFDS